MSAPIDLAGFKLRSPMPATDVDGVETLYPGFIVARLAVNTSRVYAQLRKRYAVPFLEPVPEIVLGWIVALTTPEVYRKRGWDPGDAQSTQIEQDRTDALAEIKDAADATDGLFDLPLLETSSSSGISRGGPLGSAEASPYEWLDVQREAVRGGR